MSLYPASAFAPSFALILKFVLPWLKKLAQISNGSRFYRFQIFFAPIIIVISQFHLFMDNFLCRFYDFNHFMWNNFRLAVRAAVAHFQLFLRRFHELCVDFNYFRYFCHRLTIWAILHLQDLLTLLEAYGCLEYATSDMSLARGLDCDTGECIQLLV